ncbi:MAG: glycine zipper 2TM domain-containing protein [Usitatibacter sp.]
MKKKMLIAVTVASACAPFGAFAESFTDMAPVVSVRPIIERIPVNREECWSEQRRGYEERQVTRQDNGAPIGAGTVLGAVVGGVIGHQFGNSSGGRDRGTAAGAIVGGLVGNQVDRDRAGAPGETVEVERRPVTREVERCRTVQEVRDVAQGYDVRYRYGGREFVARLPFDPGRRVRVAVDLRPVVEPQPPGGPEFRPVPGVPEYRR